MAFEALEHITWVLIGIYCPCGITNTRGFDELSFVYTCITEM